MIKEYTIKSNTSNERYSVVLFFNDNLLIPEKCSCTCKFSSFYRFTQKNKALGKICSHVTDAISMYKRGVIDNIEKEEVKNERNTKPIHPIF